MAGVSYEGYAHILVVKAGRSLQITLNAPPMNTISDELQRELAEALRRANVDPDVKVVVLTGAGRAFSAGGDIREMKGKLDDRAHQVRLLSNGVELVHSLLDLAKPSIARINGHAVGLGATVALLCDITVASSTVKIGDPHVRMGLVAGDGGALIWPFLVGMTRAKQYLLTGKLLSADEAAAIGLVTHAVPPEALDEKVAEYATFFEEGPSMAVNLTKAALNLVLRRYAATAAEAHMGMEGRTVFSDDHIEAVDAYLENRKPRFA